MVSTKVGLEILKINLGEFQMLLINPSRERFGGFLSRYVPIGLPMAIGSLAGYLKKHGINARIVNEELVAITPLLLRELVEGLEKPHIFGISCLTAHASRAYGLAGMIKRIFPDSIVIVGGVHATSMPEEALNTGCVDYVVRGEGEEVLLCLYNALRGGADPTGLQGISFVKGDQLIHNPRAPLIDDMDTFPRFPYEMFSHPKYNRGYIMSSRGCPFKCIYCSQRTMSGTSYRYQSAARVVETMEFLVDSYKYKDIGFYDDNFCFNRKRVVELCNAIINAGLHKKLSIFVQTRADSFCRDRNLAPLMVEAGIKSIGFGLETGVDRLGKLIKKGETVEKHFEAINLAKKHCMSVSLFMLFGIPTETSEDRKASFSIVQKARVSTAKYNNLVPYPGTPIYENLKGSNRICIEGNWNNFNSTMSVTRSIFDRTPLVYVPETTSEFELKRDIIRYNLLTFMTPRVLKPLLTSSAATDWYALPKGWYFNPTEISKLVFIGVQVLVNAVVAFLPLAITEPFMNMLNPEMRRRPRVSGHQQEPFQGPDE